MSAKGGMGSLLSESIVEDDIITFTGYGRSSKAQGLAAVIFWLDSGGAPIGVTIGDSGLALANTWTRYIVGGVAPAGTANVFVSIAAEDTDPNYSAWVADDTLDAAGFLVGRTDQVWDFFDGSSSGAVWDGTPNESTSTSTAVWTQETQVFTVQSTQYWIIDDVEEDANVMIPNATAAPLTEQYEEETYTLIGRGRKKEYGTRLGYTGEIDAQLRGYDGSPAMIRAKLELMRSRKDTYWLRTPFGDTFMIGLNDMTFTPIAGTSITAMYDVAIPFDEVS